jgi:transcriptional regulator with XRE-family HTH domain
MKKLKEKILAEKLRGQGLSLNEIALQLNISKSTASLWSRGVHLSVSAQKRLASRTKSKSLAGLKNYSDRVKIEKQQNILQDTVKGIERLGYLNSRDIYCIGLGLYWGEGYKTGNQEFGFTNSDPQMVRFYIHWLESTFGVKKSELILRVSINHVHNLRIKDIQNFWSEITNVPQDQFTQMSFIKSSSKKVYQDSSTYMGTLRIKVRRGTRMRREVLGAIKSVVV